MAAPGIMRVCMLTYYYWPVPSGGTENQCRRLSTALASRGHVCTVLTSRHKISDAPQEPEESGVQIVRKLTFETLLQMLRRSQEAAGDNKGIEGQCNIIQNECNYLNKYRHFLSKWSAYGVRYANTAVFSASILLYFHKNRNSFDILHVHTGDWIAGLAAFVGNILNLPVICKGADMPVFPALYAVPFSSMCDAWRKKASFIALTASMKDDLAQDGVPQSRITVIPNGVCLPGRTTSVALNSNFLYIGNFSQSSAHKGFDVLIDAWSKVCRQRPGNRLLMLGGGNADKWRSRAEQLDCCDSIEFYGYQKELTPYFMQACCLLLPSRKEGISNALLEAQSWGIPAVVSDIPGNREVVLHQENGLIVPVGDSDALAAACILMADNPFLREKYGKAARKRTEEVFSIDRVADMTVNLYKKMLTSN